MHTPIRTVIFDFGGVLTHAPGPEHWEELIAAIAGAQGAADVRDPAGSQDEEAGKRAGVRPEDPTHGSGIRPGLEEVQARYQEHRGGFDRGELTGLQYWAAVLRSLGISEDEALLRRLFELDTHAWTRNRADVLRWAAALRAGGRQTGILSNMPTEVLRLIEERMPWIAEFRPRVYSCSVGLIKPEAAIYLALLEQLTARPGEVLFLDDREENVAGARALGMHAERFQSLEQILPLVGRRYALPGLDGVPGAAARVVDGPDAAGGAAAEVPMFGHAREAAPRGRRGDPA